MLHRQFKISTILHVAPPCLFTLTWIPLHLHWRFASKYFQTTKTIRKISPNIALHQSIHESFTWRIRQTFSRWVNNLKLRHQSVKTYIRLYVFRLQITLVDTKQKVSSEMREIDNGWKCWGPFIGIWDPC